MLSQSLKNLLFVLNKQTEDLSNAVREGTGKYHSLSYLQQTKVLADIFIKIIDVLSSGKDKNIIDQELLQILKELEQEPSLFD